MILQAADRFIEGHLRGVVVSLDAADPFDVAIVTEDALLGALVTEGCELEPW